MNYNVALDNLASLDFLQRAKALGKVVGKLIVDLVSTLIGGTAVAKLASIATKVKGVARLLDTILDVTKLVGKRLSFRSKSIIPIGGKIGIDGDDITDLVDNLDDAEWDKLVSKLDNLCMPSIAVAGSSPGVTSTGCKGKRGSLGLYRKLKKSTSNIADGHAWQKHVIEDNLFPEISSKGDFQKLIEKTMFENPTHVKNLQNSRKAFYNQSDNTLVIYDPNHVDKGTCFRPIDLDTGIPNGLSYFNNSLS